MFDDNEGITYAIIHIVLGLIIIGAMWIMCGVLIDEFTNISIDLSANHELWGTTFENSINDLNGIWVMVLWVFVFASFLYGLITAIRSQRIRKPNRD